MAPRRGQTNVLLNIYDLSDANHYTAMFGIGFYHTGVEIGGEEFSFASGAGVFSSTPRDAPGARFRESIHMGIFEGSSVDARSLANTLRSDFEGDSYNILTKNCNSFSDALCQLLVRQPIPAYINRAAYLGSFFSCLVPNEATNQAPVGATNTIKSATYAPFAGSGMSLSDRTSSSSMDITDRREKMRLAALRRMNNESTQE